jgi:hypothetical protein
VLGETIAQPGSLNTLIQQKGCHGGLATRGKLRVNYGLSRRALNSAVECHLHTVEVAGSNPAAPTITNFLSDTCMCRQLLSHVGVLPAEAPNLLVSVAIVADCILGGYSWPNPSP